MSERRTFQVAEGASIVSTAGTSASGDLMSRLVDEFGRRDEKPFHVSCGFCKKAWATHAVYVTGSPIVCNHCGHESSVLSVDDEKRFMTLQSVGPPEWFVPRIEERSQDVLSCVHGRRGGSMCPHCVAVVPIVQRGDS